MDAENRMDLDAALATFDQPRYELLGMLSRTIPPTNKSFDCRMTALFFFEPGGERRVKRAGLLRRGGHDEPARVDARAGHRQAVR
jgi:hypothetical protein